MVPPLHESFDTQIEINTGVQDKFDALRRNPAFEFNQSLIDNIENSVTFLIGIFESSDQDTRERINRALRYLEVEIDGNSTISDLNHLGELVSEISSDIQDHIFTPIIGDRNNPNDNGLRPFGETQNTGVSPAQAPVATPEPTEESPSGIPTRGDQLSGEEPIPSQPAIEGTSAALEATEVEINPTDLERQIAETRTALENFSAYLGVIAEGHDQRTEIEGMRSFVDDTVLMLGDVEDDNLLLSVRNEQGEYIFRDLLNRSITEIQENATILQNGGNLNLDEINRLEANRDGVVQASREGREEVETQIQVWQALDRILEEDYTNLGIFGIPAILGDTPEIVRARHQIYEIPDLDDNQLRSLFTEELRTVNGAIGDYQAILNERATEIANQAAELIGRSGNDNFENALDNLVDFLSTDEMRSELLRIYPDPDLTHEDRRNLFIDDLFLGENSQIASLIEALERSFGDGSNTLTLPGISQPLEFPSERMKNEVVAGYMVFLNGLLHESQGGGGDTWSVIISLARGYRDGRSAFGLDLEDYGPDWLAWVIGGLLLTGSFGSNYLRGGFRPTMRGRDGFIFGRNQIELTEVQRIDFQRLAREHIEGRNLSEDEMNRLFRSTGLEDESTTHPGTNLRREKILERLNLLELIARDFPEGERNILINAFIGGNRRRIGTPLLHGNDNFFYWQLDRFAQNAWIRRGYSTASYIPAPLDVQGPARIWAGGTRIDPARGVRIAWKEGSIRAGFAEMITHAETRWNNYIFSEAYLQDHFRFLGEENIQTFSQFMNQTVSSNRKKTEIVIEMNNLANEVSGRGFFGEFRGSTELRLRQIFTDFRNTGGNHLESLNRISQGLEHLNQKFNGIRAIYSGVGEGSLSGRLHTNISGISPDNIGRLQTVLDYAIYDRENGLRNIGEIQRAIEGITVDVTEEGTDRAGRPTTRTRSATEAEKQIRIDNLIARINTLYNNIPEDFRNPSTDGSPRPEEVDDPRGTGEVPELRTGREFINGNERFARIFTRVRNDFGINPDIYFNNILNSRYNNINEVLEAIEAQLTRDGYGRRLDGGFTWNTPTEVASTLPQNQTGRDFLSGEQYFRDYFVYLSSELGINPNEYFGDILDTEYNSPDDFNEAINQRLIDDGYANRVGGGAIEFTPADSTPEATTPERAPEAALEITRETVIDMNIEEHRNMVGRLFEYSSLVALGNDDGDELMRIQGIIDSGNLGTFGELAGQLRQDNIRISGVDLGAIRQQRREAIGETLLHIYRVELDRAGIAYNADPQYAEISRSDYSTEAGLQDLRTHIRTRFNEASSEIARILNLGNTEGLRIIGGRGIDGYMEDIREYRFSQVEGARAFNFDIPHRISLTDSILTSLRRLRR